MAFIVRCPSCQAMLRVPHKVAKRSTMLVCPKCKAPIEKRRSKRFTPVAPPLPGTAPIPVGILVTDKKKAPGPPAGIPVGILDDAIVVPLARAERIRWAELPRPPKEAVAGLAHDEPPPVPPQPTPRVPTATWEPPEGPLSPDDNKEIENEPRPHEAAAPPVSTVQCESPETILSPDDFEIADPGDSNIMDFPEAEVIDEPEPAEQEHAQTESRSKSEMDFLSEREKEEMGRLVKSPQWHSVRTGLNVIYTGACLGIASLDIVLAALVVDAILHLADWKVWGRGIVLVAIVVTTLIGAGAGGVSLVGHVYCCFAPGRRGARQLAIVATSLQGAAVFFGLIGVLMNMAGAPALAVGLMIGAAFLGAAHSFALLFFLRALALVAKKRWLAETIRNLSIAVGASIVGYPLFVFLVVLIAGTSAKGGADDASAGSLKDPAVFVAGLRFGGVLIISVGFAWMTGLLVWFMSCLTDISHEIMRETGSWWEGGRPLWVPLLSAAGGLFATFIVLVVLIQLWG